MTSGRFWLIAAALATTAVACRNRAKDPFAFAYNIKSAPRFTAAQDVRAGRIHREVA